MNRRRAAGKWNREAVVNVRPWPMASPEILHASDTVIEVEPIFC
jgi:hypothetical protein